MAFGKLHFIRFDEESKLIEFIGCKIDLTASTINGCELLRAFNYFTKVADKTYSMEVNTISEQSITLDFIDSLNVKSFTIGISAQHDPTDNSKVKYFFDSGQFTDLLTRGQVSYYQNEYPFRLTSYVFQTNGKVRMPDYQTFTKDVIKKEDYFAKQYYLNNKVMSVVYNS